FDNEFLGVHFSWWITPALRYHIDEQIPDARLGNGRNCPWNSFPPSFDGLIVVRSGGGRRGGKCGAEGAGGILADWAGKEVVDGCGWGVVGLVRAVRAAGSGIGYAG